MKTNPPVKVRALRTHQAGLPVYSFFLPGAMVLEIADICRASRSNEGLDGFQRDAIKRHIAGMVDYLNGGDVLFPNAILLAISPQSSFSRSRGPIPAGLIDAGDAGVLRLPRPSDGSKCAWIVDGQQRSMALAQAANRNRPVPVVAFVSDDVQRHREQFILVNKAKPLPRRLVDELLPELDVTHLPADMAMRQIPSALVNRLDSDPSSPFHELVRRPTAPKVPTRVVLDAALLRVLYRQIHQPLGALAVHRSVDGGSSDPTAMYQDVCQFWTGVREAFPAAWGLPPEHSRLMHSAGIEAMGALMDYLAPRANAQANARVYLAQTLQRMAPHCAWTDGRWPDLDCAWNEIESTSRDIRRLSDQLIRLAKAAALRQVA
jgi:DGQHR domain-containing protein